MDVRSTVADPITPSTTDTVLESPSESSSSALPDSSEGLKKDKITVNVTSNSSCSEPPAEELCPRVEHDSWTPSFLRIGPLAGLLALLFSFLQIFASYAVLATSDGHLVTEWQYQPSVYLAIWTGISNKALAFAVVQGTVVTFWRKALKGTTLIQLNKDFSFGLYTYKALTAGRNFNILAFACIATTLVIMDGPLLQRASTIRPGFPKNSYNLDVAITPEIPAYWTGAVNFLYMPTAQALDFQPHFTPVYYEWAAQAPLHAQISGCPKNQVCQAVVRGPALAVDYCTYDVEHKNFVGNRSTEIQDPAAFVRVDPSLTVFKELFTIYNGSTETLKYETVMTDNNVANTCAGNVNTTKCYLTSAIGEYVIDVKDGVITFPEQPSNPKIVKTAKNTAITETSIRDSQLNYPLISETMRSTLSGIAEAANIGYYTVESLVPTVKGGPYLYPPTNQYVFQHITNYATKHDFVDFCAPAWKDPRDGVMARLNELMFRTGVYTARQYGHEHLMPLLDEDVQINSTVTATLVGPVDVFHSDMAFFAGAATIQLVAILAILSTLYGWWDLGRPVGLSPLEIAKAFDSPLLADVPTNSKARAIERMQGAREVRYGAVVLPVEKPAASDTEYLAFCDRAHVMKPEGQRLSVQQHYRNLSSVLSARRIRIKSTV